MTLGIKILSVMIPNMMAEMLIPTVNISFIFISELDNQMVPRHASFLLKINTLSPSLSFSLSLSLPLSLSFSVSLPPSVSLSLSLSLSLIGKE
jgi:hypothetical protein